MWCQMYFPPIGVEIQDPADDRLDELMPIAVTADPEVMANRERFLAGLIERRTCVHAPNPVRYTDTIIAVVLAQWGVLATKNAEIVVVKEPNPKEKVSKEFAAFLAEAKALRKGDDAAIHDLIYRLAVAVAICIVTNVNPIVGSDADEIVKAMSKATGRTIEPLREAFKIRCKQALKEERAKAAAAAAGFGSTAGGPSWGPGGVGGGAGSSSGPGASGKFRMEVDGLYRRGPLGWEWIAQPFEVLGLSRDNVAPTESNRSWSTLIKFQDRDHRATEQIVEHSELVVDFNDVLSRLISCGLQMSFDISQRRSVADYLFLSRRHRSG